MSYYPEKAWQVIAFPTAPVLLGFALWNMAKGDPAIQWLTVLTLDAIALGYIILLIVVELKYISEEMRETFKSREPRAIAPSIISKSIDELKPLAPTIRTPIINYNTNADEITFEVQKNLANALIATAALHRGWREIDLTEAYWKEEVNGKSRWTKLGGKSLKQFRNLKLLWEECGVLERVNPNSETSKYRVLNSMLISRIASGIPVQPPPRASVPSHPR